MAQEIKQRRIILFYMTILFLDIIIPVQGQINKRKRQSSENNEDNFIIITFSKVVNYRVMNTFYSGKTNKVSYLKYQGEQIEIDRFMRFDVEANNPLEIHLLSCFSSIEKFFEYEKIFKCLKSIDFSNFDSSCLETTENLFKGLDSLESINFLNFDTSKVTNMSHMFYECRGLKSLDLSGFDTSQVVDMSYMFFIQVHDDNNQLSSLDISGFDTSKVTNMSHMFHGLFQLTSLDVSSFNTSKVVDMSCMFKMNDTKKCKLEKLDVSNFDTSNVINMDYMFESLNQLTSLDVSGFNTSNVLSMQAMFGFLERLESLDVSNFDTSKVTNFFLMFNTLTNLKILNLSNFDISKAENIQKMFYNMGETTILDLSGFNFENVEKDIYFNPFFSGIHMKFLNIKDIKSNGNFIDSVNGLEQKSNMYLCLNDINIMQKIDKTIIICCDFDINTETCDSSNYFSLCYGNSVSYSSGFENDNRKAIAFLKYDDQIKSAAESLSVDGNKKLDIKFLFPLDNLNNFFDSDDNMNNLISIDLSNFDCSK